MRAAPPRRGIVTDDSWTQQSVAPNLDDLVATLVDLACVASWVIWPNTCG